jgi:ABC-type lipoprotein export system ATPase subunit
MCVTVKSTKVNGTVLIIGNKGSGKSSIADTLGLLGNTQQSNQFSFLNDKKFRDKKDNKARHFRATLKWESNDICEKNLNENIDTDADETVKCIPQNYLEKICTEELEGSSFNEELKKVIFSHVSTAERLNFDKLDDLIEYKTREKNKAVDISKRELDLLNKEISALELKLHPSYRAHIESKLQTKRQEKSSHEQIRPKQIEKPEIDPEKKKEIEEITAAIYAKVERVNQIGQDIDRIEKEKKSEYTKFVNAKNLVEKLENFEKQYMLFIGECTVLAQTLGINVDDIVSLKIEKTVVENLKTESWRNYSEKSELLDTDKTESLPNKKNQLQKEIDVLRERLDKPNKDYQAYLKQYAEWEAKLKSIIGDEVTQDTVVYYEKVLEGLSQIPAVLLKKTRDRMSKVIEIHTIISQLRDEYSSLYKPVKSYIATCDTKNRDKLSMDFRVAITCEGFQQKFLSFINQNKKGSFYGTDDGQKRLRDMIDSASFETSEGIEAFLNSIDISLHSDQRDDCIGEIRFVFDQLRQDALIQDLYNFIYSLEYLKPKFILRWAGKDLSQLSPGERGTVLLIFYLFISLEDTPLIIDQPEENLDNETVYTVLVPCIKEAKNRRQIIIVTHNPNLAVVCDADQIVHCAMKKEERNKIIYTSGAIENPSINKALIDVLEGTQPAFDNRDYKYYAERIDYV